ncbi:MULTISPECIES: hypothetical protein [Cupriavidus]
MLIVLPRGGACRGRRAVCMMPVKLPAGAPARADFPRAPRCHIIGTWPGKGLRTPRAAI